MCTKSLAKRHIFSPVVWMVQLWITPMQHVVLLNDEVARFPRHEGVRRWRPYQSRYGLGMVERRLY